ncbi:alpha/beta hydrolase family protein [Scytonema sp. NUACC26]|uniref:alpha/beta hydrolase family protein n=1 Tax=Scytonema sp. NUACC26 TaxID=3140176 RepID=UPI0038B27CA0
MSLYKILSVATLGTALIGLSMGKAAAVTFSNDLLFQNVASYTTTIADNNDLADIYYPNPSNLKTSNYSFPVVLLLQGSNIDKSFYSNYASLVARYGFVVVVPNHIRILPQGNVEGFLPEPCQINAVLSQMQAENANPETPVSGVVNTLELGLLGHSAGGYAGLAGIANACLPFFCESDYSRPQELKAGAFFGSFLRNLSTQEFVPINNSRIPVALLHGTLDSINTIDNAKLTYEQIQEPPKLFVTIDGANHYGITNINDPSRSGFEKNVPTIAQDVAIETIARWSGLFLRASILGDKDALNYVYFTGDIQDENVTVTKQLKSVSEAPLTLGLMAISTWSVLLRWKRWLQSWHDR